MVAQPKQSGLEAFLTLPDDGMRHEFVRGEVRTMPPPKGMHGLIEADIITAINRYLEERARALGWDPEQGLDARRQLVGFAACGEFGLRFATPDDPVQVRGADGAYVPAAQLAATGWDPAEYFPAVPALVLEVVSPSEAADDVTEKVADYLAGGARRVWCAYPSRARLHVHDADGPTRVLRLADTLDDAELLPGFALPLRLVFPT